MRRIGFFYIIILASQVILIIVLATQRGLILSNPASYRTAWTTTWGGQYQDYSYGAVFSCGALYVTGDSYSSDSESLTLVLLKYSQDGELNWSKTFWEDGHTMGRGVASDGDYIYVGGIHMAENSSYSLLLKYDPQGHLMWSKEWRPGLDAKSSSIAVDDFGDVYITGYVIISAYENRQFLLKYDKEGTLLYSMVIDSSGSETAWGISASDAVYICGEVTYNATLQGETARARAAKMLLRKISLEGKMLWSRESSIGLDNVANSVDSEQEIIVVGYTGFANGTAKSVLLRFSKEGELKSTLIIGESFIEDMAWGVTRAGRYLYVVGHARSSLNDLGDVSVHKLGPDFEILWENYFNNYIIDRARAATVDGDDIYVVGETYWKLLDRQVLVRKYVSPNFALTSEESRIIKLSPLVMGIILFIISIYEMTRHTAVK